MNTAGSYTCVCSQGFTLSDNRTACLGENTMVLLICYFHRCIRALIQEFVEAHSPRKLSANTRILHSSNFRISLLVSDGTKSAVEMLQL